MEELKEAVRLAHAQLEAAIADARAGGVVVNLWIYGDGPTGTGPSHIGLEFGEGE